MSKSFKIFLIVLALISVGLSLSLIFAWNPLSFLKSRNELTPIPTPIPVPAVSNPIPDGDWMPVLKEMPTEDKNLLTLPVEEKYFDSAMENGVNLQALSFYLDGEASIKAIFKGKITKVLRDVKTFPQDNAFNEIILNREDDKFSASYVIFGEVLVDESDTIEPGQEIAKAKEGGLGFRMGANLSLWIHDKDGEFVTITKELFGRAD